MKSSLLLDADQIGKKLTDEVYKCLSRFEKGFWIANFCPWVHPLNRVPNCMALLFDGFIHYKFSVKNNGRGRDYYQVAKRSEHCFVMDVKVGDCLTLSELVKKIKTAKVC